MPATSRRQTANPPVFCYLSRNCFCAVCCSILFCFLWDRLLFPHVQLQCCGIKRLVFQSWQERRGKRSLWRLKAKPPGRFPPAAGKILNKGILIDLSQFFRVRMVTLLFMLSKGRIAVHPRLRKIPGIYEVLCISKQGAVRGNASHIPKYT